MANNVGDPVDSSGQIAVDFVWGNLPMQPNDDRAATISNIGGSTGDYGWSATTQVASGRLDATQGNHAFVEATYAGFPNYTPGLGSFIVTGASGNGTTVTYQSQNFLAAGQTVNVTGLSNGAFNLSSATVATSNATSFTVTNSAGSGVTITGQTGKVEPTNALDAGDGAGIGNINVPNVLGLTTAQALDGLKDRGYEAANITTASAATNSAKTVTAASRTAGQTATTITATSHGYVAGNKVTLASVDSTVNGTYSVVSATTNNFVVNTTATTVLALTGLTGSATAVTGTIKTQSTAAGAAGVATNATITITPWA